MAATGDQPNQAQPDGNRMEEFSREVEALKLRGGTAATEDRALKGGAVAMIVSIVLAVLGIILMMSTSDAADQRAFASQTFWLANILVVIGAVLFLRYSLGRYLRFWMVRLIHEQRTQTDRIVEAIDRASGPIE